MYYSDELIDEVRSRSDIVDVVGSVVHLTKKGSNHWGLCPFHNEHTASFSVNGAKQMYHCFGCGEGGNVFRFMMKYENLTFPEAVKQLADRAGVTLPEETQSEAQMERSNKRARLLAVNKDAATYFYHVLRNPHGKNGLAYLQKRELTEATMQKFGLGFAGINGDDLVRFLREKGYTDEEIRESGLAVFSEKRGLSCQFWNRVMFPIFDSNNRVIGFGGRIMGDGQPKYLNSPETPIFDKRRNLYGLNLARKSRSGNFILCEGYMDVISLHQAGFDQAVASLGTAFTAEQAMLLGRYTKKIYLAYDSDGAGVKAALRAIGILRDTGLSGRVIDMRPYKDPDEFIKNLGAEAYQERIDNAENSFFYEIRQLAEGYDQSDPESRTEFQRAVASKLCVFTEDAERENYLQAVAEKYMIGPDHLRTLVAHTADGLNSTIGTRTPVKSGIQSKTTASDQERRIQGMLLTYLTDQPELYKKVKAFLKPEDFTEGLMFKVAAKLFEDFENDRFNPSAIIDLFEDEEEQKSVAAIFQTVLPYTEDKEQDEKAFHDILFKVKQNSYEQFSKQATGDLSKMTAVMERKKELENLRKMKISF